MAYAAMNNGGVLSLLAVNFLNGVCRHELQSILEECADNFLNGVCRHEL